MSLPGMQGGQSARLWPDATGDVMPAQNDRSLAAAGMVLIYATLIGFADNFVRVVAAEAGLWQFHVTRSLMALPLILVFAWAVGHRVAPVNRRAVIARSAVHGLAMLTYFGALAFLPVAIVAAGLFTAPIFVLLISGLAFGERITAVQVMAVAMGFGGVILLLGPAAMGGASLAALLPVLAGALYALGNIATRRWCAGESAETLLAGFFAALFVLGVAGLALLWVIPLDAPPGTFLFWVTVQAVVSVIGVGLMIRAYHVAPAATVSVLEYVILPISALWSLWLWDETLGRGAILGMVLIVLAGMLITLGPRQAPTAARQ
jgi:drug/metabolite transporter (DMT)-like permease